MTIEPRPAARRFLGPAVIVVLVALIVLFVTIGVRAAAEPPSPTASAAAPAASSSAPIASGSPTDAASATPTASTAPTRSAGTAPSAPAAQPAPQPTRTADITKPAPITEELTAKVSKLEAVQGKADGPGEIGGPAVRFTITINNATGRAADLSNAVVNAYYGGASTPAIPLQNPGGTPFPKSVAAGSSASGVFLFNIPPSDRGAVEVTVDTSVKTPVVAFRGAAPR